MNLQKMLLLARAEKYEGKPFWSKPVDARIKDGYIDVKMKLSYTVSDEPQWVSICGSDHPNSQLTPEEIACIEKNRCESLTKKRH